MQLLRLFNPGAAAARFLSALGLSLALVLTPTAGSAQDLEELSAIGEWRVFYVAQPGGAQFCGASRYYDSDAWVHIDRISTDADVIVTVYSAGAPRLEDDVWYELSVALETAEGSRGVPISGFGRVTTDYNGVSFYARQGVIEPVMKSRTIRIDYAGFASPVLALDDAFAALQAVEACAEARF